MSSNRRLLWGAVVTVSLTVSLIGPIGSATACSVCLAGDPLFDALGTTAQARGGVNAYFEVRGWKKESGLLPGEDEHGTEFNDSQRADLFLSWTPVDRITLTLNLPWAFNTITEEEDGERETSSLSGFGDMSLAATGVLWRNRDALPSTWLEGRAFVKFPTGESNEAVNGRKDPHLQPGTGSWDFGFGVAGVHRVGWGSLFGSVLYRVNTEGSLDYEYGDVMLANAVLQVPLGHAMGEAGLDWLTPELQLNFRYAGYDEFEGQRYDHSGGSILYLTPGLSIRLPWFREMRPPSLRGGAQIPLTSSWLNGRQHEDPVWFFGLQYAF
jgi:hypothetical protein